MKKMELDILYRNLLVEIGSSRVDQRLIEMLLGHLAVKIINRIKLPVLVMRTRAIV